MIDLLAAMLASLTDPVLLGLSFAGVVLGLVFGALPGVSSTMALAVVLPFTYGMETPAAMMLMLAVFFASVYAGSVSAILLNIPGTPGAMFTLLDGHAMARKGQAAQAMAYALIASILGGVVGWVLLVALAPVIAAYALNFGSPEYAAVVFFGLALVAYASSGDTLRGLAAGVIGLLVGVVGRDKVTDVPRFTFGTADLQGGIDIIPLAIGVFGIAEALNMLSRRQDAATAVPASSGPTWPSWRALMPELPTVLRSSAIGTFVGAIPAAGSAVAVALAYAVEKRLSKRPETFGTGLPRGVVAPEAANNACVGGALIPMMTLGIPGDSITAVLIGVLLLHGLRPGPGLFESQPDLILTIYAALFVAIVLTALVAATLGISVYRRILAIPHRLLLSAVLVLCVLGAFSVRNATVDVWVAIFFGGVGFAFLRLGIPVLPLAFGAVLGPLLEDNLRRTLMIHGDPWVFFERPISLVLVVVSLAVLLVPTVTSAILNLRRERQ
ncbi:tripartite tricarboxylate transporter permease [Tropicimonas sediminicola]|uniref:Putative tricarboxylic transport membrane protein n=1 Tax=Tropicimonas sediminicola TaxID=1031541 RepID=A0A239CB59_9RHOB|nr:tripartite tricarboxylate transporter permease [Tropicimonas sediminicola]SNS17465.1 putative tricarboxylic transport membrane protein [Tropicimonas sediminicola]